MELQSSCKFECKVHITFLELQLPPSTISRDVFLSNLYSLVVKVQQMYNVTNIQRPITSHFLPATWSGRRIFFWSGLRKKKKTTLGCLIKCFILPASRISQFKLTSLLMTEIWENRARHVRRKNLMWIPKDDSRWSFLHVKLIAVSLIIIIIIPKELNNPQNLEISHLFKSTQLSRLYQWQIIFSTTRKIPNRICGSQKADRKFAHEKYKLWIIAKYLHRR